MTIPNRRGGGEPMIKSFDQLSREHFGQDWTGDRAVASIRQELAKAMGINDLSGAGITGTQPLMLENLDMTLTEVLVTEAFMKVYNAVPKVPSKNAFYEYTRKKSYGSFRGAPGFREGGAPKGTHAKYIRKNATIKYLGERGGLTHQLSVAGDAGGTQLSPVTEENRNTTIRLMAKVERQVIRGRESIKDTDGNVVNYDGIMTQMEADAAAHVVDLKGAPLDFARLDQMGYDLRTEGKLLSFDKLRGFVTGTVMTDLGAALMEKERTTLTGTGKAALVPGTPFKGYESQFGYIPFEDSQFLDEVEGDIPLVDSLAPDGTAEADEGAPPAPAAPTGTAGANAASTIPAATYYYWASAMNEAGESLAIPTAAGVVVTAGQQVTVSIPRVNTAIGYRLYRGKLADGSDARWIATIPQPPAGAASHIDTNQQIPGSGTAMFFNADSADLAIAQLAPLIKWPLAIVNTTVEFLLLLYHVPVVKAHERVWIFKNIGRAA